MFFGIQSAVGSVSYFQKDMLLVVLLLPSQRILDRAEVNEFGVHLFDFSESNFLKIGFYKCSFQMVTEFSFVQEGINQVTKWFNNDVDGISQCPRWDL